MDRKKKILAVDDSRTALLLERTLLEPAFDVVTASTGEEGLKQAAAERPDLILMDVEMPGMTGLEACRRLRAAPATERTPIILVTCHSELESLEGAFANGCTDYVIKPVDGTELLLKVRSYLAE